MEILSREFIYIWYYFTVQLEQIFGWWVLGMVIGSAVSVFAKDSIHRAFRTLNGKRLGVLGIAAASALGIASPLCMYGTIPIAASISKSGMRDSWLAAFMMSSILLNPQLIVYSAALGGTVLAVRIVSCFLCGITAGLLLHFFYRDKPFFDFTGFDAPKSRDTDPNLFLRYLKNLWRNVKATGLYFLIGILLSALFQRYVPAEAMFISLVRKYTRARKLTPRMLNELIEKIEVFNAEKIDGVWEQRLRIHYNCVGVIEIPDLIPLPAPEVSVNTRKGVVVNYAPSTIAG